MPGISRMYSASRADMHEHKSPAYALHAQELANLIAKASQGMQPRSCSHFASTPLDNAHVNESIGETQQLLQEMVAHLSSDAKMDARKAVAKLERIAALASTAALIIQVQR